MSKEILEKLENDIEKGDISVQELEKFLHNKSRNYQSKHLNEFKFDSETVLSFVGGAIVLLGVLVIISFNFENFGDIGQVLITLGSGVFLALASMYLHPLFKRSYILNIVQLVASFLTTVGIAVLIGKDVVNIPYSLFAFLLFISVAIIYTALDFSYKKGVFTFIAITNATMAYYSLLSYFDILETFAKYRAWAIAGLVGSIMYILIAKLIWNSERIFFKGLILNLGAMGIIFSLFGLVYYEESGKVGYYNGSTILEHLYLLVLILFYMLASRIQSKILLLITSISLFYYFMYMFIMRYDLSNNLGIGLVLAGGLMVALGYGTYRIGKRFIPSV